MSTEAEVVLRELQIVHGPWPLSDGLFIWTTSVYVPVFLGFQLMRSLCLVPRPCLTGREMRLRTPGSPRKILSLNGIVLRLGDVGPYLFYQ